MAAAFTVVMNQETVGPLRTVMFIEFGRFIEHDVVHQSTDNIDWIYRASRKVDDVVASKRLGNADCAGRVRCGRNYTAIKGTRTDREYCRGMLGDPLQQMQTGLPLWSNPKILAVETHWNRSFNH